MDRCLSVIQVVSILMSEAKPGPKNTLSNGSRQVLLQPADKVQCSIWFTGAMHLKWIQLVLPQWIKLLRLLQGHTANCIPDTK